jgi:hypothetical protein
MEAQAMDKDLKDAVLAAFDGEPEDGKGSGDEAAEGPAEENAGEAEGSAAAGAGAKAGAARKKVVGPTQLRRAQGVSGAARKPGAAGEEAPQATAAAVRPKTSVTFPREGTEDARPAAARPYTGAMPAAGAASGSSMVTVFSLALTLVLAALVVVLMIQMAGVTALLRQQEAVLRQQEAAIRDLRRVAQFTVSVYQEPGKRPQLVTAAHDVDADGKAKLLRMTIKPLEDESR